MYKRVKLRIVFKRFEDKCNLLPAVPDGICALSTLVYFVSTVLEGTPLS